MQVKDEAVVNGHEIGKFPWKLALTLYSLSYLPMMLFSRAYFWDDWLIYEPNNAESRALFRAAGYSPLRYWIEIAILNANPVLFRLITLLIYFATGWLFFYILSTVRIISAHHVRISTLLFLILPINSARVAMIDFSYSYSLLFFYLAWYLLVSKKSIILRMLSIPVFLISFGVLSTIIFYIIPCCHFGYQLYSDRSVGKRASALGSLSLFLIAPLYYLVDSWLNPKLNDVTGYYTPKIYGIAFASVFIFTLATITIIHFYRQRQDFAHVMPISVLLIGVDLVAIGASPYLVGGHFQTISEWLMDFTPGTSDWHSRHQLLLGLGFSLMITALISCAHLRFQRFLLLLVFSICVLLNMNFMNMYYLDSIKQNEIIAQFRSSELLLNSKVVMINDNAKMFNARGRGVRTYEWNGMLSKAFGSSKSPSAVYYSYIECQNDLIPDTLLTITARNLRIVATLKQEVGVEIEVESINPCS